MSLEGGREGREGRGGRGEGWREGGREGGRERGGRGGREERDDCYTYYSDGATISELPSLPIFREISRFFDQIMKISRSPDLESKSPDFLPKTMLARSIASFAIAADESIFSLANFF